MATGPSGADPARDRHLRRLAPVARRSRSGCCPASMPTTRRAVFVAVIVLALLNVLIRPVLIAILAPISVIAVAIATLVWQVVSFLLLDPLVAGLVVDGFWAAFIGSFVYAIANTVLTAVFSVDAGRLLLRDPRRPAVEASRRRHHDRQAGRPHRPDRRSGPPDPVPPGPGRAGADHGQLAPVEEDEARPLGRPSCHRRRPPARRASSTATTASSRHSGGGRSRRAGCS